MVKLDVANDLALPLAASRAVKLVGHIGHGGFFQHRLARVRRIFNREIHELHEKFERQIRAVFHSCIWCNSRFKFFPDLAKGEIASLSGLRPP